MAWHGKVMQGNQTTEVTPYGAMEFDVVSGNGLLPDSTKSFREPKLIYHQLDLQKHEWNLNQNMVVFIKENTIGKCCLQNYGHFVSISSVFTPLL